MAVPDRADSAAQEGEAPGPARPGEWGPAGWNGCGPHRGAAGRGKLELLAGILSPKGVRKFRIARAEVIRALQHGGLDSAGPAPPDSVVPSAIPSVAAGARSDRVLAEIDRDGFAFAVDPRDAAFFNRRAEKLPRTRTRIEVVLHAGAVRLRKQFPRQSLARAGLRQWSSSLLGVNFYNEAAALLRLRDYPAVPTPRLIERASRTIYMDYIRGEDLRHSVARSGAAVYDIDIDADPILSRLNSDERDLRELEIFSTTLSRRFKDKLQELTEGINRRGVALKDVKLGHILIGESSGALYWVDLEWAGLSSHPHWDRFLEEQKAFMKKYFDI